MKASNDERLIVALDLPTTKLAKKLSLDLGNSISFKAALTFFWFNNPFTIFF